MCNYTCRFEDRCYTHIRSSVWQVSEKVSRKVNPYRGYLPQALKKHGLLLAGETAHEQEAIEVRNGKRIKKCDKWNAMLPAAFG